ncbi:MAG TPA: adenylate cyclase regulatory domain-containing protein [Solirubrobacterales bacterium]|nr:adenylate cyclase regulatory domain-containing protein [Solirubrobacterales bacterium]
MAEIDFEAEGLLEGVEGEAREARLKLLGELAGDGVPLEELRDAVAAGRLALLPVERTLIGEGERYNSREVAEKSGVDLEVLQRWNRALGIPNPDPDDEVLGDADLDAAKQLKSFRDLGLPEEEMMQVARTIGMAMARIAQSNRELFIRTLVQEDDDEHELARRFEGAAKLMLPQLTPVLTYALQRHLVEQVRGDVIAAADLASGEVGKANDISVCFADLVDFTKLGERVDVEELGLVAGKLEDLATSIAEPPVRLVKTIGDAAMLVSNEAEPLGEAALQLIEAANQEGEGFPLLRIGIAYGPAVGRGGDYYGAPVNLASRITGVARPGSVLASEEAKEALGEGFHYSFAGERKLKGVGSVKLFRVREGDSNGGGEEPG